MELEFNRISRRWSLLEITDEEMANLRFALVIASQESKSEKNREDATKLYKAVNGIENDRN